MTRHQDRVSAAEAAVLRGLPSGLRRLHRDALCRKRARALDRALFHAALSTPPRGAGKLRRWHACLC